MILLTYRHGLRAAEVCDFRWDQIDFAGAVLHVRRVKNGIPSTHRSRATSCGRCAGCTGRAGHRPSSSSASAARRSPRPALPTSSIAAAGAARS
jgi:integrase